MRLGEVRGAAAERWNPLTHFHWKINEDKNGSFNIIKPTSAEQSTSQMGQWEPKHSFAKISIQLERDVEIIVSKKCNI